MTRRAVPGLNWLPRTSLSGSGTPVQRARGEAYVPLMSITRRTGESSSVVSYCGWPEVVTVTATAAARCSTLTSLSSRGGPGASAACAAPVPAPHRVITTRELRKNLMDALLVLGLLVLS